MQFQMIAVLGLNLALGGCSAISAAEPVHPDAMDPRPNVILILTDDLGYGDLGYHGNTAVRTPNIDRLASESVRLTNFHVDPTCSPTRAALMTGKHSLRTGVWLTVMGRSMLPADEITLAEHLREHGYRAAIFGKWHLGDNFPFRPQDQGFDEVVIHGGGGVGQAPDYWGNTQFDDTYFRDGKPVRFDGYATAVWFDEAIRFIRENRRDPFFAYIATNAPHQPWRAPQNYIDPYLDQEMPRDVAAFYAMTAAIDDQVGRLSSELGRLGLDENTILIFTSDNGSALLEQVRDDPAAAEFVFNAGMRGAKGDVYDGGHRVPFFLSAPLALFGESRDVAELTAHTDVLPTLLDVVGAPLPRDIDGRSLLPMLRDNESLGERSLVVTHQRRDIPRFERPHVLITDRWRYVRWVEEGIEELYDVSVDPGQATNAIERYPEIATSLRQELADWWEDARPATVERQRIIVGNDRENPARLNPMDWVRTSSNNSARIPFFPGFAEHRPDTEIKGWIGREHEYQSLPWYLTVAKSGRYDISLYLHDAPGNRPVDSQYGVIEIRGERFVQAVPDDATHVTIGTQLDAGKAELRAWFSDDAVGAIEESPAMYVYIEKK